MYVIEARNVNDALPKGLLLLKILGRKRSSRNGEVSVMDGPVTTKYNCPRERVLFWPARDANPFFHLFESLWMLNGSQDVKSVASYVKRMATFSDDGVRLHGAYGYRWIHHFKFDQLTLIINRLMLDPDDRRCVLQIWDANADLNYPSNDLPCNTQVYFTRDYLGKLDMTVCCRSNDIIWGAYGANAVHFSMLQEFMAAGIGCEVGTYWQLSNNFHAYTKTFVPLLEGPGSGQDYYDYHPAGYADGSVRPHPLVSVDLEDWRDELFSFINGEELGFQDPFFADVAVPMRRAYQLYREEKLEEAIDYALGAVTAMDWNYAANFWLQRRLAKRKT